VTVPAFLSRCRLEHRRKQDPNAAAVVVLLLNKPKTRHTQNLRHRDQDQHLTTSRTHNHCNTTHGLNTETNKLNELTRGVAYMNTNEEREKGNRTEPSAQR